MTLASGSRLGPYEIVARIGAGGMGEVFRARDTRLERSVAIKILPPELASSPQQQARFEREARTISQLNHPHICTVHDFGQEHGTSYLVMELVEGETLAARISRGALPLAEVVRYGAQIAEALGRAHRAGIIHRDLKPGNVMITKSGAKLLDFGLARAAAGSMISADAPTQQAPITATGTIVGTMPYMAPEQLHGLEADSRTDIFALGAVLYEMITGRRAFDAKSSASLIAQIIDHDPPRPSELQPVTPAALEHLILTCLAKDPDARLQCAADIAYQLRWIGSERRVETTSDAPLPSRAVRPAYAVAALLLLSLGAAGAWLASRGSRSAATPVRAAFTQLTFDAGEETHPAIAPDGKMFAFAKTVGDGRDIFLQRVDGRSAINLTRDNPLDDSEPAFSPSGDQIAFRSERDGGGIFVMGATGESVRRLTEDGFNPAWSPDGRQIVYGSERIDTPRIAYTKSRLHVVDVATGATRLLFDGDARQPQWSPQGHRIAFFAPNSQGRRDVYTIAATGDPKSVVAVTADDSIDWNPLWSVDGRSLYFASERDGTMNVWRVGIDEKSGAVDGAAEIVRAPSANAGWLSLARGGGGQLLFQSTVTAGELVRFRFDPATETLTADPEPVFAGSMPIQHAAASPDGKWVAFTTGGAQEDLFVVSADGTLRQLTNDAARDRGVSFWPDSSRILFYSNRNGIFYAFTIRPDGSGLTQLTAGSEGANWPRVSFDGSRLAYTGGRTAITDARIAKLDGPLPITAAESIPRTPHGTFFSMSWSLDGKRLAGTTWGGSSRALYVYTPGEHTLRPLNVDANTCAFVDDRRIVYADRDRGAIGVVDAVTGQSRRVGSLPGSSGSAPVRNQVTAFSPGGGILILYRTRAESDVWLMTLGDARE